MQWLAIRIIHAYRFFISPLMTSGCRFYPSCSRYAEEAIGKHGLCHGVLMTVRRICRCHPYNPGGYDPVE